MAPPPWAGQPAQPPAGPHLARPAAPPVFVSRAPAAASLDETVLGELEEELGLIAAARRIEAEISEEEIREAERLTIEERLEEAARMGSAAYVEEAMEAVDRIAETGAAEEAEDVEDNDAGYEEEAYEEEAYEEEGYEEEAYEEEAYEEETYEEEGAGLEAGEELEGEGETAPPGTGLFPRMPSPPPPQRLKRLKPRESHEFPGPGAEVDQDSDVAVLFGTFFNKNAGKGGKKKVLLKFIPAIIAGLFILVMAVSGMVGESKKSASSTNAGTAFDTSLYFVTIDHPYSRTVFKAETIAVSGSVSDYRYRRVSGATVTVTVNEAAAFKCVTDTDGAYSATVTLGKEGRNTIKVSATKGSCFGTNTVFCDYEQAGQPAATPTNPTP